MNDLILIKTGALGGREAMPKLNEGELGFRTDTKEFYIGADGKNVRLCGVGDAEKVTVLETQVSTLEAKVATLEAQIIEITARLDAIQPPGV